VLSDLMEETKLWWRSPDNKEWTYRQEEYYDDIITSINSDTLDLKTKGTNRPYKFNFSTIEKWISSFNTGGYTGKWGPEGKMAMLHEKEIVLNKEDTVNLLDSIKLLRSILTTIDL
jgi:hypothetical protein